MAFPEIKFGICLVCGARGRPQTEDLSSADAPARSTSGEDGYDPGNGVILKVFRGVLSCGVCINEAKADSESLLDAKKQADEERFRSKAGFVNTVED